MNTWKVIAERDGEPAVEPQHRPAGPTMSGEAAMTTRDTAQSRVAESLLDDNGEVVVGLADGWTLRSGVYNKTEPDALTSGEYVRLCKPNGDEYAYWDQEEWRTDPALVMGAIINSAAGLRLSEVPDGT